MSTKNGQALAGAWPIPAELLRDVLATGVSVPNTRRTSTTFRNPQVKDICLASVGEPTYSKADNLRGQDAGSPPRIPIESVSRMIANAARRILELHSAPTAGGNRSTVSLTLGNVDGLPYYAVSAQPERNVPLSCPPTVDVVFFFAAYNSDLLMLPDHALATTFQPERGLHVLDVVRIIASVHEAIQVGISQGQQSIVDLHLGREIPLISAIDQRGGTQ